MATEWAMRIAEPLARRGWFMAAPNLRQLRDEIAEALDAAREGRPIRATGPPVDD